MKHFTGIVLCVLLSGPTAWADDQHPEADTLVESGFHLRDAGRYQAARESFRLAYEKTRQPELFFHVAETYRREGNFEEALVHYKAFVSLRSDDADMVAAAHDYIRDIERVLFSREHQVAETEVPDAAPDAKPAIAQRGSDPSAQWELEFGLGVVGRSFRPTDSAGNIRPISLEGIPAAQMTAEVAPFRRRANHRLRGLSLRGSFSRALLFKTEYFGADTTDTGLSLDTHMGEYEVAVSWRFPIGRTTLTGDGFDISADIGVGRQYLIIDDGDLQLDGVFDIDYRYGSAASELAYTRGALHVFGRAGLRFVRSAGIDLERMGADSVMATAMTAGGRWSISRAFAVGMTAMSSRYHHSFEMDGSASDATLGVMLSGVVKY